VCVIAWGVPRDPVSAIVGAKLSPAPTMARAQGSRLRAQEARPQKSGYEMGMSLEK